MDISNCIFPDENCLNGDFYFRFNQLGSDEMMEHKPLRVNAFISWLQHDKNSIFQHANVWMMEKSVETEPKTGLTVSVCTRRYKQLSQFFDEFEDLFQKTDDKNIYIGIYDVFQTNEAEEDYATNELLAVYGYWWVRFNILTSDK